MTLNSPEKKLAQVDGSDVDNDCISGSGSLDNGVSTVTGNYDHVVAVTLDVPDFGHVEEVLGRLLRKAERYPPMILADLVQGEIDSELAAFDNANPVRNALDLGDLV